MKFRSKSIVALAVGTLAGCVSSQSAMAGEADIVAATAIETGDGVWRIEATVRHADEGWDHYANNFEVLAPDGSVLAVRTLAHPHVNEQPFTRSLGGVAIPNGMAYVTIRARDSVHEYGGAEFKLDLPGN
ncbi:MAG: hypothetical protein ABJO09_12660 [Hyphomicrobiales bacterium]